MRIIRRPPSLIPITSLLALTALAPPSLSAQSSPLPAGSSWEASLDSLIESQLARTKTPGAQVAVVHNGQLIYSKGFGVADIESGRAVTPVTLFRVGSVTKMVTGAVATQLAAENKLDLNAPISRYVPELANTRVGSVTTHQLLTHTAGWLDNATPYGRMGEGALGEVMTVQTDTLFFTEPGRVISYSNPGYSMAGYVAERAGAKPFGTLADELVLTKFGMANATFRPLRAMTRDFSQGHVGQPQNPGAIVRPFTENTAQWAAGFLFASAQEMGRFAIGMMDGGMLDGQRVLAADAVQKMTTGDPRVPGDPIARYGYGLMITKRGDTRVWTHGGSINGFDAQVVMFPDHRLAVVVLDNRSGAPLVGITDHVARAVVGIVPPGESTPLPDRVATAAERAQYAGVYSQGRTRMEIVQQGDSLVMRQGMILGPVLLIGEEQIVFTAPNGNRTTMFVVRDASGRVEYLHRGLRAMARQP